MGDMDQPQGYLDQPQGQVMKDSVIYLEEIKSTKMVLHPKQKGHLLLSYIDNMVLQPQSKDVLSFQASTFLCEDAESILVDAGDIEVFPQGMVVEQQEVPILPRLLVPMQPEMSTVFPPTSDSEPEQQEVPILLQPLLPMQPEMSTVFAPTSDSEPEVEDLSTKTVGQGGGNNAN